jgi:hypothetical protein
VRRVRTASGATAVQIVHKRGRTVLGIDHIGSAHDDSQLAILLDTARAQLNAGQQMLPIDDDGPTGGRPIGGAGGGGHGIADPVGDAGGGLCFARLRPDRRQRVQSTRVGPDHRANEQGRRGAGAGRARRARSGTCQLDENFRGIALLVLLAFLVWMKGWIHGVTRTI